MTNEAIAEAAFAELLCLLVVLGVGGLGLLFCRFLRGDD